MLDVSLEWAQQVRTEQNRRPSSRPSRADPALASLVARYPDRSLATVHAAEFAVSVDRELARCRRLV